jgi:hypothetical protein
MGLHCMQRLLHSERNNQEWKYNIEKRIFGS